MEMQYYLRIIQRGWWLILASVLIAVNTSLVYSYYVVTPVYEAGASFIVSPNLQNIESRDLVSSLATLDKRSIISTYAEVLNSRQIINNAIVLLGQDPKNYLMYVPVVTVLPDANIISFNIRGPDPQVAAQLTNSVGQYAIDYISNLYVIYNIDFLDKATVPSEPIAPRPVQDALLAFLIGIVIGVGLAIFRDQLTSTLDRLGQRKMIDSESRAYTRLHFERLARQEMQSQPAGVVTLALIYLNGIQDFYDSLPQVYINKIMHHVTDTLKYQLRGNDIVGKWSHLHFSVFLSSTDGASAIHRMEQIREVLNQPISLEENGEFDVVLDPRIGMADRQGGESLPVLVEQAGKALEISRQSDEKVYQYKIRPFG